MGWLEEFANQEWGQANVQNDDWLQEFANREWGGRAGAEISNPLPPVAPPRDPSFERNQRTHLFGATWLPEISQDIPLFGGFSRALSDAFAKQTTPDMLSAGIRDIPLVGGLSRAGEALMNLFQQSNKTIAEPVTGMAQIAGEALYATPLGKQVADTAFSLASPNEQENPLLPVLERVNPAVKNYYQWTAEQMQNLVGSPRENWERNAPSHEVVRADAIRRAGFNSQAELQEAFRRDPAGTLKELGRGKFEVLPEQYSGAGGATQLIGSLVFDPTVYLPSPGILSKLQNRNVVAQATKAASELSDVERFLAGVGKMDDTLQTAEKLQSKSGVMGTLNRLLYDTASQATQFAKDAYTNLMHETFGKTTNLQEMLGLVSKYVDAAKTPEGFQALKQVVTPTLGAQKAVRLLESAEEAINKIGKGLLGAEQLLKEAITSGKPIKPELFDWAPEAIKRAAETIAEKGLQGDEALRYLNDASRVELLDTIASTMAQNAKTIFGVKAQNPAQRFFNTLKSVEAVLYLGLSPVTLVKNAINNKATMLIDGLSPFTSNKNVAKYLADLGLPREAFEPLNRIGGMVRGAGRDFGFGGSLSGQGLAGKISEFGDKFTLLKFYRAIEEADRAAAFASGVKNAFSANAAKWSGEIWQTSKGKQVLARLQTIDPEAPKVIQSIIEANLHNKKVAGEKVLAYLDGLKTPYAPMFYDKLAQHLSSVLNGNVTSTQVRLMLGYDAEQALNRAAESIAKRVTAGEDVAKVIDEEFAKVLNEYSKHLESLAVKVGADVQKSGREGLGALYRFVEKPPTVPKTIKDVLGIATEKGVPLKFKSGDEGMYNALLNTLNKHKDIGAMPFKSINDVAARADEAFAILSHYDKGLSQFLKESAKKILQEQKAAKAAQAKEAQLLAEQPFKKLANAIGLELADPTKPKAGYFVSKSSGNEWIKVEGAERLVIPGFEDFDLFVHRALGWKTKDVANKWTVSEGMTGLQITSGKTKEEVIDLAKQKLVGSTPDSFLGSIVEGLNKYGVSPRYQMITKETAGFADALGLSPAEIKQALTHFSKYPAFKTTAEKTILEHIENGKAIAGDFTDEIKAAYKFVADNLGYEPQFKSPNVMTFVKKGAEVDESIQGKIGNAWGLVQRNIENALAKGESITMTKGFLGLTDDEFKELITQAAQKHKIDVDFADEGERVRATFSKPQPKAVPKPASKPVDTIPSIAPKFAEKVVGQEGDATLILGKKIGNQLGTNEGGVYEGADGVKRYVKLYKDGEQSYVEQVANALYRELGLGVPQTQVFQHSGKAALASELLGGTTDVTRIFDDSTKENALQALRGFLADVFLGNRDAVGAELDNMILHNGQVYRIDNGGSLLYRGLQGKKKTEELFTLSEFEGFQNPSINAKYAKLFKAAGIDDAAELNLAEQYGAIKGVLEKYGNWQNFVDTAIPGASQALRDELANVLTKRYALLQDKVAEVAQVVDSNLVKKLGTPTKLKVSDLPTIGTDAMKTFASKVIKHIDNEMEQATLQSNPILYHVRKWISTENGQHKEDLADLLASKKWAGYAEAIRRASVEKAKEMFGNNVNVFTNENRLRVSRAMKSKLGGGIPYKIEDLVLRPLDSFSTNPSFTQNATWRVELELPTDNIFIFHGSSKYIATAFSYEKEVITSLNDSQGAKLLGVFYNGKQISADEMKIFMKNNPQLDYSLFGGGKPAFSLEHGIQDLPKSNLADLPEMVAGKPFMFTKPQDFFAQTAQAAKQAIGETVKPLSELATKPQEMEFVGLGFREMPDDFRAAHANLKRLSQPPETIEGLMKHQTLSYAKAYADFLADVAPILKEFAADEMARGVKAIPEDLRTAVVSWLAGDVASVQDDAKKAAVALGKLAEQRALLNYDGRYNVDNAIAYLQPFAFWRWHSAQEWAQRFIDRPALAALYLHAARDLDTVRNNPEFPTRLRGKTEIPLPLLQMVAPFLGDSMFVDIPESIFPLKQIYLSEAMGMKYSGVDDNTIAGMIRTMIDTGAVSQAEGEKAIATKRGTLWETAKRDVAGSTEQQAGDLSGLFRMHLPFDLALKIATGNAEDIGTILPFSGLVRGLTSPLVPGGVTFPESTIKQGLRTLTGAQDIPMFDAFDEYRQERALRNLVADGKITPQEAVIAMMEHKGKAWDMAVDYNAKEGFIPALSSLTGFRGTVFPQGEREYYQARLQRDRLVDEEIKRLGYDPKTMSSEEKWDTLKRLGALGAESPITKFGLEHPEIKVTGALFAENEGRLLSYLSDEVKSRYYNLSDLDRKRIRVEMGDDFANFVAGSKAKTPIEPDLDTLAKWATKLGAYLPKAQKVRELEATPKKEQFQLAGEKENQLYQEYLERYKQVAEQLSDYYALPDALSKRLYLDKHPEVKQYFEWSDKFWKDNPELAKMTGRTGSEAEQKPKIPIDDGETKKQLPSSVSPELAAKYDEWLERYKQVAALQDKYYSFPEGSQQRKDFLVQNPQLKAYFEWNSKFWQENPELAALLGKEVKPPSTSGGFVQTFGKPQYGGGGGGGRAYTPPSSSGGGGRNVWTRVQSELASDPELLMMIEAWLQMSPGYRDTYLRMNPRLAAWLATKQKWFLDRLMADYKPQTAVEHYQSNRWKPSVTFRGI